MLTPGQEARLKEGTGHQLAGRFGAAAAVYEALFTEAPEDFRVCHLLGALRYQQGRPREALRLLGKARAAAPGSAPTLMCLGLALGAVGRHADAEKALRAALAIAPDDAETWSNLGAIYALTGRLGEAEACFHRAIGLRPGHAPSWTGLGSVLHTLGRSGEAVECHSRALRLDPGSTNARFARGQALQGLQRPGEALADFDAHLARRPGHHQARSFRLYLLNYRDDLTREQVFAEHRDYGRRVEAEAGAGTAERAWANDPDPGRRLRLAFLSPDLRGHSVAYFLEPILAHLDREAFDVLLYHDHHCVDEVSRRLRAGAAVWRQFAGCADSVVAETILADAPDVLVDLDGHTGFNRMELFALRLAPVQITYLGYPATTGLRAMDYRLTDAVADPPGETDHLHTERLLRFSPTAWAYAPPSDAPAPALPPGLRGGPPTFGCFNAWTKASDRTLRVWRRVMDAVPSARLLLKSSGMEPGRCRRRLEAAGFPLDRVDILTLLPGVPAHLARYAGVDVALDPFPYNGTTTTCEALWMGVPVVALAGDRHAARVGASLLGSVGHPEWAAGSEDEYVAIAARLAADRAGRLALRTGLREEMARSPLMDHAGQAERFGAAVRRCWAEWCRRRPADAPEPALAGGVSLP